MSEGELKKRIKEESWIDGEFRVANYDSFRIVLDKAKKEFPQRQTLFSGTTYQAHMESEADFISYVLIWKDKWFGADPK